VVKMNTKAFVKRILPVIVSGVVWSVASGTSLASDSDGAFKVGGKVVTMKEVKKANEGEFFELEKKRYSLVEQAAREKYLDYYWEKEAKKSKKSVAETKTDYFAKNATVSADEVKSFLEQFKDHPQLSKMPKAEQEKQIRDHLQGRKQEEALEKIVEAGRKSKELVILVQAPKEPVFNLTITGKDKVRYAAIKDGTDPTAPQGCSGNDCPITIVEYSEFQCPFCKKTFAAAEQVMTEYKGKARWIVRDFPLSFHDRARPAAVAATCAGKQNKYWQMYKIIFDNQQKLADADLEQYAKKSGVDMKQWQACVKSPGEIEAEIDAQMKSGMALGVNGTPAFFINGRKLPGAVPYADFRRVIEDELASKKRG
jgi:protein-disulfide isomerase